MPQDIKTTVILINKAKGGDDAAFNLLLDRYLNRVLHIVRMRLGSNLRKRTESMDVVQGAMIRAIKTFESFEPKDEAAFIHWMSTLVQNEIRDLADYHFAQKRDLNKEIKKTNSSNDKRSVTDQIPANSIDRPSYKIQLKEDILELEKALDQLKEDQKEIVIMRQYEGMSFIDIGKELDCSADAARMKFARAIDKLTDLMT